MPKGRSNRRDNIPQSHDRRTNTQQKEYAPYYSTSSRIGDPIRILTADGSLQQSRLRNQDIITQFPKHAPHAMEKAHLVFSLSNREFKQGIQSIQQDMRNTEGARFLTPVRTPPHQPTIYKELSPQESVNHELTKFGVRHILNNHLDKRSRAIETYDRYADRNGSSRGKAVARLTDLFKSQENNNPSRERG